MTASLPSGAAPGLIRQLRPSDFALFREHLLRLDAAGRRDRFNGPAGEQFIDAYVARCLHRGASVIGYVEEGAVRAAAELHERDGDPLPTGEIAFSVEHTHRNRGLGGRLFGLLIENARWHGYRRLLVTTHPQNAAMKRLARRFEADLRFQDGETVGTIDLGSGTAGRAGAPTPPMATATPPPGLR